MRAVLRFIASAYGAGKAYIDVDGTILHKYLVGDANLDRWMEELMPTRIIWSRMLICYVLYWLGVRLVIWTNRPTEIRWGTMLSLGRHIHIFSEAQFHGSGRGPDGTIPKPYKSKYTSMPNDGPVMDDHPEIEDFGAYPGSLHVRAK